MEWISSLLGTLCPYCRQVLGSTQRACRACAEQLTRVEAQAAVSTTIGTLAIVAATSYVGWAQALILAQKNPCSAVVTRWMAELLSKKIPAHWRKYPVLWLPGKPLRGIHLVEALALELARCGHPLVSYPYLQRRLKSSAPQKTLELAERKARDIREIYKATPAILRPTAQSRSVILLDDVVTTGSTLIGCQKMLQERLGVQVRGALALAYTPVNSTK